MKLLTYAAYFLGLSGIGNSVSRSWVDDWIRVHKFEVCTATHASFLLLPIWRRLKWAAQKFKHLTKGEGVA